jgi:uracil-DNA glycosylase
MGYDELVLARKSCHLCKNPVNPVEDLVNPADPPYAQYDGPEVGPWSRWLASRPAKLILVGQDWGTEGYFRAHRGRDIVGNLANTRLTEFLSLLGFTVGPPTETDSRSGVFTTNAILCLKPGTATQMSLPVKSAWFAKCQPFLRRTIEEVAAPVVITLGVPAYKAVTRAYGLPPKKTLREVVEGPPTQLDAHRRLFAVFHPSARARNRTEPQMRTDWTRIAQQLSARSP